MVQIYISYAPADAKWVGMMMEWLEPLRQKYYLQIFYDRYDSRDHENIEEKPERIQEAHIYLFFVSHLSLAKKSIEENEVKVAMDKYVSQKGENIRIYPIIVSPCAWQEYSGLVKFTNLALPGAKSSLLKSAPIEDVYLKIINTIEKDAKEMRTSLLEEAKLRGEDVTPYFTLYATPKEKAPPKKFLDITWEQVKSWLAVAFLLFLIYSLWVIACTPRYGGFY